MTLLPGDRVGPWEIVNELGEGGMGKVFLVRNVLVPARLAAMKVVPPEGRERFQREISVLAAIEHPNVVKMYDPWQDGDRIFMVMEYVQGESLDDVLKRGPLAPDRAIEIVCQVLDALEAAHARTVIHRDIKPGNIMLTAEGKVKLLDFGIARMEGVRKLTETGTIIGSLRYISPEQCNGLKADHRSDLYAVGVTLYQMLTRQWPFDGDTRDEVMIAILRAKPDPPERLNPMVPSGLSKVIRKAMAKSAADRHQSAAEMRADLMALVRVGTQKEATLKPPPTEPLHSQRRRGWTLAIALALVLGVGTTAVLWPRKQATAPPEPPKPATPSPGEAREFNGMRYRYIPEGTFMMGCSAEDSECSDDEKPPHEVQISKGFWIKETEVTVGEWKRYARMNNGSIPQRDDSRPMTDISWHDSNAFCAWAGGRLPTEAEWEYAGRGKPGASPPRHGPLDRVAWYISNAGSVRPVAGKDANNWGLYDMLGNVWEWVNDWEMQRYSRNIRADPKGPIDGRSRGMRGGWANDFPVIIRISYRSIYEPDSKSYAIGCRCARD